MTAVVHIDIESYSACDLKETGVFRYAEDSSTDLTAVTYASGTGPVHFWAPWDSVPQNVIDTIRQRGLEPGSRFDVGRAPPALLAGLLADKSVKIAAHNNQFERTMLGWPGSAIAQRYGLPDFDASRAVCTMARAAVYGLPHALEGAAKAMGTSPKREVGVAEMRYFSKPRKNGTRATPTEEPDRYIQLALYCLDDTRAERDLDRVIPQITAEEQKVYELDQRINRRGVLVDLESVNNMRFLIDTYKLQLAEFCRKATGLNPTQTGKLAEWVRANGYPQLTDLQAPTVVECIEDAVCPDNVKKVLRAYSTYAGKAVSKYESMPLAACSDGRLRGLFRHYGAGPGRWSSSIVQLHNLMRSIISDADVAIELARLRSLEALIMMYDPLDPMRVIASCTRGMLVSPPGRDFLSFDFSQIEARIRCWLAGQEDMLQMFRDADARGKKAPIYERQGAKMFGLPESQIVDQGVMQYRTAAKIGDLACGFQGWEAAVRKMARQQGIKLSMDPAEIAGRWRDANPLVTRLWKNLNDAAAQAIEKPGTVWAIPNKRIMFKVEGRWLYMRLPSGRRIAYLDPQVEGIPEHGYSVNYMGVDTDTRRWMRSDTYGGKILQNATEGTGRDFLTGALLRMEDAGYDTVAHVHDQGLFEIDEGKGSLKEAEAIAAVRETWADGLPVKADGWRKKRFRK